MTTQGGSAPAIELAAELTARPPGAEPLSPWQERTIERNLIDAKRRLLSKSSRFVEAARALLLETGSLDFTVQEVVERARLSLRAFYQAFASKDDLLLALFEESTAAAAVTLGAQLQQIDDPLEQIHTYLSSFWTSPRDRRVIRSLVQFQLKVSGTRPEDMRRALDPVRALLRESVERGIAAGRIRPDVDPERTARMLMHIAITAVHTAVIEGTADEGDALPADVWSFCLQGIAAERPVTGCDTPAPAS